LLWCAEDGSLLESKFTGTEIEEVREDFLGFVTGFGYIGRFIFLK